MKKCTVCGDLFMGEEVSEWRADHEPYSDRPFICPDCYDRLQHKDLEDQFDELMKIDDMEETGTSLKKHTLGI